MSSYVFFFLMLLISEVGLLVIIICWGQRLNVFQICQDFPDDCLGFILRLAPKYPMLVDAQSPALQTQLPRHSDWQVKAFLESRKGESVAKAEIKSGSWLGMEAVTRSKSECSSFSLKRLESFISPFCNHCGRDFHLYSHSIRFLSRPLVILGNKTLQKTL